MNKFRLGTIGIFVIIMLLLVSCSRSRIEAEVNSVLPQKQIKIITYNNQYDFENESSSDYEVLDYCICGEDVFFIKNGNDDIRLIQNSNDVDNVIYQIDNGELLGVNSLETFPNYKCSVIQETMNSTWEYQYNVLFVQNDNQIVSFSLNWENTFKPVGFSITHSNKLVLYSSTGVTAVFDIVINNSIVHSVSYEYSVISEDAICLPCICDDVYYTIVVDGEKVVLKELYLNGVEKNSIDISSLCSGIDNLFVFYNEEENILYFGTDSGLYTTDFSEVVYFSNNIPGIVDYLSINVNCDRMFLKAYVNHFGYGGISIIESTLIDYDEEQQQVINIGYINNSPASNSVMLSTLCERYHLSYPQIIFELIPIDISSSDGISDLLSSSDDIDIVFGSDYEISILNNYLDLNNEWDYSSIQMMDDYYNNILEVEYDKYNGYVISPFFCLSGMTIPQNFSIDSEYELVSFIEGINNIDLPLALSNTTDYIVLDWILNNVDSDGEILLSDDELKICLDTISINHNTIVTEQETAIHYCRIGGIEDYVNVSNWYSQGMRFVGSPNDSIYPYLVLNNSFSVCDCSDDAAYDYITWLFCFDAQRIGVSFDNISVYINLSKIHTSDYDVPITVINESNGVSMIPPICSNNTIAEVSIEYCSLIANVTDVYNNDYELRALVYSELIDYLSGLSGEDETINEIRNICYLYMNS